MATIAVGDIHGNLEALTDILDQIHGESSRGDTIVFLGDYIDRGPDTKGCVDAILGFQRAVDAEVVCLIGNHEDWLLRTLRDYARHSWLLGMEAFDTIRSYSVDAARTLSEAVAHAGPNYTSGTVRCRTSRSSNVCPQTISASLRACVFITQPRIVCALTVGWIPASLVLKSRGATP